MAPYRALVEGVASLRNILALCLKVREQYPLFQLAYQGQQALCRPNLRGPAHGGQDPSQLTRTASHNARGKQRLDTGQHYRSLAGFRTIFNVRTSKSGAKSTQFC
jgi:hypothetical protein